MHSACNNDTSPRLALVGLPSAPNAAFAGGPRTRLSTGSCRAARSGTITDSRRGVPCTATGPCDRRRRCSSAGTRSLRGAARERDGGEGAWHALSRAAPESIVQHSVAQGHKAQRSAALRTRQRAARWRSAARHALPTTKATQATPGPSLELRDAGQHSTAQHSTPLQCKLQCRERSKRQTRAHSLELRDAGEHVVRRQLLAADLEHKRARRAAGRRRRLAGRRRLGRRHEAQRVALLLAALEPEGCGGEAGAGVRRRGWRRAGKGRFAPVRLGAGRRGEGGPAQPRSIRAARRVHPRPRPRTRTRDLARERAHRREAVRALRHADGAARVEDVERVAELEQVVVGRHRQALGQQAARLGVKQRKALALRFRIGWTGGVGGVGQLVGGWVGGWGGAAAPESSSPCPTKSVPRTCSATSASSRL